MVLAAVRTNKAAPAAGISSAGSPIGLIHLKALLIILAAALITGASAETTLTYIRQVRELSAFEAASGLPVRVNGVVTYLDQLQGLFLLDTTGGIYVHGITNTEVKQGVTLAVTGISGPGRFAPVIHARFWSTTGTQSLPAPIPADNDLLFSGHYDSQWIMVQGIVRRAVRLPSNRVQLDLGIGRDRIPIRVQQTPPGWENALPGSRVTVQGVCLSSFNDYRQFLGPHLGLVHHTQVTVNEPAPANLFDQPGIRLENLLTFYPASYPGQPVKVAGVVTFSRPGGDFCLRDEDSAALVRGASSARPAVGDRVEVVGFPAPGLRRPRLEDAQFRRVSSGPTPEPRQVAPAQLAAWESELVAVEATVAQAAQMTDGTVLVLENGGMLFSARLDRADGQLPFAVQRPSSRVRVIGVCELSANESGNTPMIRLLLRTGNDVQLLRSAPWWTLRRLAAALMVIAACAMLALIWILLLRRQVRTQTRKLREQVEREAVAEERTRLARELHDSLEQDLAGIRLQVETAQAHLPNAPAQAAASLQLAHMMVRRSQVEARQAVWDLRPAGLEAGDLCSALQQLAAQATHNVTLVCFEAEQSLPPLRTQLQSQLYRLAQEAVANALRHAQARHVTIRLGTTDSTVDLCVSDDGHGFDPGAAPGASAGHFGLAGMRERARKLGADFHLHTVPGHGTEIRVTAPLNSPKDTGDHS